MYLLPGSVPNYITLDNNNIKVITNPKKNGVGGLFSYRGGRGNNILGLCYRGY